MGAIEILWTVTGIVVPLLLGTAWAMIGLTPPEFWIAKGCVIVAAIIFAGTALVWLVGLQWPTTPRIIAAIAFGAVTLVVFSESLRWVTAREELLSSKDSDKSKIDYAWGLVLEKVQPSLDVGNSANTLELRLELKNASGHPLKFLVEKFEQKIEEKNVSTKGPPAVIAKDGSITWFPGGGFTQKDYKSFKDRTTGNLSYSITYGHPDLPYSRRTTKELNIDIIKKKEKGKSEGVVVLWKTKAETDVPIERK